MQQAHDALTERMTDDIDTPNALAIIEKVIEITYRHGLPFAHLQTMLNHIDSFLGLKLSTRPDITDQQKKLVRDREVARNDKDWQKSDELRDSLSRDGIGLRDTENGTVWYRL
jgi:cysteinyl-tRNA synthetase